MAVTIKRGNTQNAHNEYICYYHAFACMTIKEAADAVIIWTFDDDAAPVFADMEYNTVTDIKTGEEANAIIMSA